MKAFDFWSVRQWIWHGLLYMSSSFRGDNWLFSHLISNAKTTLGMWVGAEACGDEREGEQRVFALTFLSVFEVLPFAVRKQHNNGSTIKHLTLTETQFYWVRICPGLTEAVGWCVPVAGFPFKSWLVSMSLGLLWWLWWQFWDRYLWWALNSSSSCVSCHRAGIIDVCHCTHFQTSNWFLSETRNKPLETLCDLRNNRHFYAELKENTMPW